jgi:hypothetical protein
MAPRRKQQQAAAPREQGREVKLRVPESIMKSIEERAAATRRPINATIVELLSKIPDLEEFAKLGLMSRRYEAMLNTAEVSFARYSSEIALQVLSRELLDAIDMLLDMEVDNKEVTEAMRRPIFARLRVLRAQMKDSKS